MESTEHTVLVNSQPHSLKLYTKLAYSVGHVLNDLCASMWFTYFMVYFHLVLNFNSTLAGALLLVGQVADGLATPFIGFESDRMNNFKFCKYGRRKTWHLFGTVCVLISFPFIYLKCVSCENSHQSAQFVYYAAFIIVFQFGWAAVQISHLSLINDITTVSQERVELNSLRYAFTVISNICVYGVALLYMGVSSDTEEIIKPSDNLRFRNIVFTVIGIGTIFSIIFHVLVHEPAPVDQRQHIQESISQHHHSVSVEVSVHLRWKDWFKQIQFYKVGLLYMCTRLYVNLSQVFFPLFLQESLQLHRNSIATIPLVIYLSGFIASFFVNYSNKFVGHKLTYFVSTFIAIVASVWIYFSHGNVFKYRLVYVNASLVGVAGSAMLITSLAITSDMIGHNTSSGAFVFGAMSFLDKLSNGIAVMIVQYMHPCTNHPCEECQWYYSTILSFVCGGAAVFALVAMVLIAPYPIEASRRMITVQAKEDGSGFTVHNTSNGTPVSVVT